jgi:hypothetical protein
MAGITKILPFFKFFFFQILIQAQTVARLERQRSTSDSDSIENRLKLSKQERSSSKPRACVAHWVESRPSDPPLMMKE